MASRTCECRWHLIEETKSAIRVSIFKGQVRGSVWVKKQFARITKREGDMITFTMDFSEARKRGMI